MYNEDIKKMCKPLPKGIYTRIAKKLKMSPAAIRNTANGRVKNPNDKIVIELIKARDEQNKLKDKISELSA